MLADPELEFVTFFTFIPADVLSMPHFYRRRVQLQQAEAKTIDPERKKIIDTMLEKDRIGWIAKNDLKRIVGGVKFGQDRRPVAPVRAELAVIDESGAVVPEMVTLRPFFMVRLRSYLSKG